MDYLQICQRVHDIAGFQGQFTSVQATGYQAVITTAVKDAYEDIQRYRSEWNWLKTHRTINIDSLKDRYELTDLWGAETPDLAAYRHINWYSGSRKRRLIQLDYDKYMLMKFSEPKDPRLFAVEPWSKALLISPVDQVYTLDLHYTKTIDALVSNTQIPLIPGRFHELIVYGALMKVSTYIGNPTLYDTYNVKYAEAMGQLMREENPARWVYKRPVA